MTIDVGFRTTVVTEAMPHGTPGIVTVTRGAVSGTVLVIAGLVREAPSPRLMLQLNAAQRRALCAALTAVAEEQGQ